MSEIKPSLLIVIYANPDRYPPTFNAVRLLASRFRVHLICRADGAPAERVWPEEVRIDRVGPPLSDAVKMAAPAAAKLREYASFVAAVRRAVDETRPRVIYAYEPHAFVAAMLARSGVPVVHHRHEVEEAATRDLRSLQGWIMRAALWWTRRADLVVFPEKHRARVYLDEARDPRPALLVPNYPLLDTFPRPEPLAELVAQRLRDQVVFYRGAIGDYTSIPEAIGALAHLPADVRLRLRGPTTPEYAAKIAEIASSLGVADRVSSEGYLPSFAALNRETTQTAVGLVLYKPVNDSLRHIGSATNKLWEYAACALPVVATDGATFRDVLASESWAAFADPNEPEAIARAVRGLLADPNAYAARCAAARRAFEERFHFEAVFEPLLAKLLDLASERSIRP